MRTLILLATAYIISDVSANSFTAHRAIVGRINSPSAMASVSRARDAATIALAAGGERTRPYEKAVRKVYARCNSGKIQVTVRDLKQGFTIASRTYGPGESGGAGGGNGVRVWGKCIVEIKSLEPSNFYYHVEWD